MTQLITCVTFKKTSVEKTQNKKLTKDIIAEKAKLLLKTFFGLNRDVETIVNRMKMM